MKTSKRIFISTLILLAIVNLGIYLINIPFIKVRMFSGDRITGSFNMSVNNIEYDPVEASVKYEKSGTYRLTQNGNDFSIKGGEYGRYDIVFYLENRIFFDITDDNSFNNYPEQTPLCFSYINAPNWNIADIYIKVSLEKEGDDWNLVVNILHKYLTEDYKTYATEYIDNVFIYKDIINTGAVIQFGL